jgi:uncharacterized iron-regulated protein
MHYVIAALAIVLAIPQAIAAAGETPPVPVPNTWESRINADHPLVGTLKRVSDGADITPAQLADAIADARFILVGETHNNPDHHALQAWVVRTLAERGRRPAIAFEMLDADQAEALQAFLEDNPESAAGLGQAVGWGERGWPIWSTYQPIADAALATGMPLRTADVAPATQRHVGRKGFDGAVPPGERARLALATPLGTKARERLITDLVEGHCNMLPESAMGPMARVQRLRDAVMADSLIAAHRDSGDGAVLIAGRGHVRADRAVPWYLRERLSDPSVLTIGIVEAFADRADWRGYLPESPDASREPFDYLWVTPRYDDTDHCAELRKKMQQGHGDDGMSTANGR